MIQVQAQNKMAAGQLDTRTELAELLKRKNELTVSALSCK